MPKGRYLPPVVLQLVGILLLIGAFVFWGLTGHQSALLVGAALSLIGLGAYSGLRISVSQALLRDEHVEPKDLRPPQDRS